MQNSSSLLSRNPISVLVPDSDFKCDSGCVCWLWHKIRFVVGTRFDLLWQEIHFVVAQGLIRCCRTGFDLLWDNIRFVVAQDSLCRGTRSDLSWHKIRINVAHRIVVARDPICCGTGFEVLWYRIRFFVAQDSICWRPKFVGYKGGAQGGLTFVGYKGVRKGG